MTQPMSIRNQSCSNPSCLFYQQTGQGNVVIHSRKKGRLRCAGCRSTWVQRKNQLHYRCKIDPQQIDQAMEWLEAGLSKQQIARRIKTSPRTIRRWKKRHDVLFKS